MKCYPQAQDTCVALDKLLEHFRTNLTAALKVSLRRKLPKTNTRSD